MLNHYTLDERMRAAALLAWAGIVVGEYPAALQKVARIAFTGVVIDTDATMAPPEALDAVVIGIVAAVARGDEWFSSAKDVAENNRHLRDIVQGVVEVVDMADTVKVTIKELNLFLEELSDESCARIYAYFDGKVFPQMSCFADHLHTGEGH